MTIETTPIGIIRAVASNANSDIELTGAPNPVRRSISRKKQFMTQNRTICECNLLIASAFMDWDWALAEESSSCDGLLNAAVVAMS